MAGGILRSKEIGLFFHRFVGLMMDWTGLFCFILLFTSHLPIHPPTGSMVRVKLTLYPQKPYLDFPYYTYGQEQRYNADIYDNRYYSTCVASFDAVTSDEEDEWYAQYYYRAASGILLFGVATYVTMKRKVICSTCRNGGRDRSPTVAVSDHYKNATDDYDASSITTENYDGSSVAAVIARI
jgi:hypothetical protein